MANSVPGGEPRHFMRMAIVLTAIILLGFGLETTRGRTDYAVLPWTVYAHALTALAWCGLAIVQPWLIGARHRDLHRRLGWLAAGLAIMLAIGGIWVTVGAITAGRMQPAALFLMLNLLSVIAFLGLVGAAIRVRRRTDWHRRLLTGATIILTGPAWARILPMELLGPAALFVLTAVVVGLAGWGMVWDRRVHGRVHPAWWWSAGAVAAPGLLWPLAFVPAFAKWAEALTPA